MFNNFGYENNENLGVGMQLDHDNDASTQKLMQCNRSNSNMNLGRKLRKTLKIVFAQNSHLVAYINPISQCSAFHPDDC